MISAYGFWEDIHSVHSRDCSYPPEPYRVGISLPKQWHCQLVGSPGCNTGTRFSAESPLVVLGTSDLGTWPSSCYFLVHFLIWNCLQKVSHAHELVLQNPSEPAGGSVKSRGLVLLEDTFTTQVSLLSLTLALTPRCTVWLLVCLLSTHQGSVLIPMGTYSALVFFGLRLTWFDRDYLGFKTENPVPQEPLQSQVNQDGW